MENRQTFFARVNHLPRADVLRMELAYTLAKFAHRAQTRNEVDENGKRIRYFEHVREAAIILLDEAKIDTPALVIALLLHDGVEDTRDLTREVIEFHFGCDVARHVSLVSKDPKEGFLDRLRTYGTWETWLIKACDRLHNLRTLSQASDEFRAKQVTETRQDYYPIFNTMADAAPTGVAAGVRAIRDKIVATTEAIAKEPPRTPKPVVCLPITCPA